MDCPRCQLSLNGSEYEGQPVQFCGNCWGYWLTRDRLDAITRSTDYTFSRDEARAVEHANMIGDANRQGAEFVAVACPECAATMERKLYAKDCPVEIDECPDHGVWLDTGEIKDLQVFIERGRR